MSGKMEIFATIWNDFVPLSLHHDDSPSAIASAKSIAAKASAAGHDVARMDIRAVHIAAESDTLEILFSVNGEIATCS